MQHPLLKWAGIAVVAIPLLVASAGLWWYFQDDKLRNEQWYQDDQRWNAEILEDLARVQARLAHMETEIIIAIDRHEEFVSTEHRDGAEALLSGISTFSDDLNYRVGVHQGQHMAGCIPER